MDTPGPWPTDADFLTDAFAVLKARAARIAAERAARVRDGTDYPGGERVLGPRRQVSADEAARRSEERRREEMKVVADFEARLDAHRRAPGAISLGLDAVCHAADLGDDERLIALALTATALGQQFADDVFGDLGGALYGATATVDVLATIIDARSVPDRLRVRTLFARDSRLLRHGLVAVEFHGRTISPEDIWPANVALTARAFGVIVGQPVDDGEDGADG